MTKIIKVLIIDDSALIRKLLTEILSTDKEIEVVGAAQDPYVARELIKQLKPDVITLDVEMPRMDGLTFLSNLMRLHPLPVIMISSLTDKGADVTLQALELGAIDFVSKPKIDVSHTLEDYREEIIEKIKAASVAHISSKAGSPTPSIEVISAANAAPEKPKTKLKYKTTDKIIAIGASTGGTEAIKDVLVDMPADAPGIVITQHIPEEFSRSFAERMNKFSQMTVCEAKDGQQVLPGHAYIAPGHSHLLLEKSGARYICKLSDAPPVNRHRPSVEVLFRSVVKSAGINAIGILLTGMGADGAQGLKEIQETGAMTIAQDEKTCVVWGMPGEAVKLGAADHVLPLNKIAAFVLKNFVKA